MVRRDLYMSRRLTSVVSTRALEAVRCPICWDSLSGADHDFSRAVMTTQCGHRFCAECIKRSLQLKKECPVCRVTISHRTLRLAEQEGESDTVGHTRALKTAEDPPLTLTDHHWQCRVCTLANEDASLRCSACHSRRPSEHMPIAPDPARLFVLAASPRAHRQKRATPPSSQRQKRQRVSTTDACESGRRLDESGRVAVNGPEGELDESELDALAFAEPEHPADLADQMPPDATEAGSEFLQMAAREGLTLETSSNASGYRNVAYSASRSSRPYQVQFRTPGLCDKTTHLGYFATAEEGALAYARHKSERALAPEEPWWEERGLVREQDGLPLNLSRQSATGYHSVTRDHDGRYRARIDRIDQDGRVNLGRYETAVEAAMAVARFHRGEQSPQVYDSAARSIAGRAAIATKRAKWREAGLMSDEAEEAHFARIRGSKRSLPPEMELRYLKWRQRESSRQYRDRRTVRELSN